MTASIKVLPNSIGSSILHNIRCIRGKEKKVFHYESGKPKIVLHHSNGESKIVQEGTTGKEYATFEKVVPSGTTTLSKVETSSNAKNFSFPWGKGLKISIWLELALLALRHFAPEIESQIPAVYKFLDAIVLPVINWLYAIGFKLINWLISQDLIAKILDVLRSIAT